MLDKELWTTISVVLSGLGVFLTGIANLVKALSQEKKQPTKRRPRRFK